jgi:hypothetical protein
MKNCVTDSKAPFTFSRPIGLDSKTWRQVEPIFEALQQAQHHTGRFRFYGYLVAVYRTYKEWKDLGISKRMARQLAKYLEIPRRKGTSRVRTLIDATFPTLESEAKKPMVKGARICRVDKGHRRRSANAVQELFGNCWLRPFCSKREAEKG